jgi:hypothetical protein
VQVEAWRVHDTGLVAVPSRFRRLGGLVRHHHEADPWPDTVTLVLDEGGLSVTGPTGAIGRWPREVVTATAVADGPPVSFVLEVPTGPRLLAAASGPATAALLAALGPPAPAS